MDFYAVKVGEQMQQDLGISTVPRWSIVPHLRPQSVAEHSWRTARIAMALVQVLQSADDDFAHRVDFTYRVVYLATMHDVEEAVTGDMPRTTKNEPPNHQDAAYWVVDLADKLEALTFIYTYGVGWKRPSVVEYMSNTVDSILDAGVKNGYITHDQITLVWGFYWRFLRGV